MNFTEKELGFLEHVLHVYIMDMEETLAEIADKGPLSVREQFQSQIKEAENLHQKLINRSWGKE